MDGEARYHSALQHARVLVVDDEPALRRVVRRLFAKYGAEVLEAGTRAEALDSLAVVRPDAVLLDLGLPDGDGLDVCRAVRALPGPGRVPVAVVTGSDPTLHHIRALEAGADDFVSKPYAPRILLARLCNLIERYRAERDAALLSEELGKYLSAAAVERVLQHQEAEQVEATILFSDLRGFTATSFESDLEPLFNAVSAVLRRQVDRIQAWGGYVDKFSGDGLLAVFQGADGPTRACAAAADIIRWARETDEVPLWQPPPLGLGIHVGRVLRGDLGSERRREHTVLGPVVNVAARLCGHAEALQVLVSSTAARRVVGSLRFGPEFLVTLRGLPAPLSVCCLDVEAAPVSVEAEPVASP
jgi:adenylate cyclase